ncbi:MAG TPA: hypothetical protein PKD37_07865 [Oligoflexia bacterium]|nr:hypothetical protein [Oligoflexia bacterium]HMP27879.1 hypothetical protein [Oligoflexia bacterium]
MKGWSNSETPTDGIYLPEKKLLAAVLQRAVADFITGEGDLRENARAWLFDDQATGAPLTFKFVCEALDLDAKSLRETVADQNFAAREEFLKEAVH